MCSSRVWSGSAAGVLRRLQRSKCCCPESQGTADKPWEPWELQEPVASTAQGRRCRAAGSPLAGAARWSRDRFNRWLQLHRGLTQRSLALVGDRQVAGALSCLLALRQRSKQTQVHHQPPLSLWLASAACACRHGCRSRRTQFRAGMRNRTSHSSLMSSCRRKAGRVSCEERVRGSQAGARRRPGPPQPGQPASCKHSPQ